MGMGIDVFFCRMGRIIGLSSLWQKVSKTKMLTMFAFNGLGERRRGWSFIFHASGGMVLCKWGYGFMQVGRLCDSVEGWFGSYASKKWGERTFRLFYTSGYA